MRKSLGTLGVNDPQIGTIPVRTVKSPSFNSLKLLKLTPNNKSASATQASHAVHADQ